MKNTIASLTFICLTILFAHAQKISVHAQKENINEQKIKGYKSTIEGVGEHIIDQWTKHLRSMGKYRPRGTYVAITNFSIDDRLFEDSTIYATTQSDESSATVWLGTAMGDGKDYSVNKFLKSSVHDFTAGFYRRVVQKQIEEAERAVSITTRRHQRLLKDSVEFSDKLSSTKNEILRLEQLAERNRLETKVLNEKLFANKTARDSVQLEIRKMKQVAEEHKRRKNAIE